MRFRYCLALTILLFPALPAKSQINLFSTGATQPTIEYLWPKNGDIYVPQKTTLIVRPSKELMQGKTAADFSFVVHGVQKAYTGRAIISDDGQTVIFKFDSPLDLNDHVHVNFSTTGEGTQSLSFDFTVSSMSEVETGHALYQLHEQEKAEMQTARELASPDPIASLPMNHDTVMFSPAIVDIDTAKVHEGRSIFFAAEGNLPSPYAFIGIVSDTASQNADYSNNVYFEKELPVGCGNFKMETNGTYSFFQEYNATYNGLGIFYGSYIHLDPKLNPIDTFNSGNGYKTDEHDFHLMSNGHAIVISYDPQHVDMTTVPCAPDTAKKSATVFGAIIQELDASKNVIMQWRSWDHYSLCDATRDVALGAQTIDPFHLNTAEIDSTDGNMIASFRHLDAVVKIDWKTDSTIWHWGGKHNLFTFSGPNPTDTLQFSHQHDPQRLANGHITMWDNGNLHTTIIKVGGRDTIVTRPSSRAVEYVLDEVNHTATVAWEYTNLPYSLAAGNVQRFTNGNTLMGLGFVTQPSAIEVTPAGDRVFQMSIQNGAFAYRTYRFPFTPFSSVRQTGTGATFAFASIYPNPAQSNVNISFSVAEPGAAEIELLDILGQPLRSVHQRLEGAGTYVADFDVRNLPSGVYACRFSQNGKSLTKTLVVQK